MDFYCSPTSKLPSKILSIRLYNVHPFIISRGSITFPNDFDIFLPCESRIIGCKYTVLKGILSNKSMDIIAILATQKNKMSAPVSNMVLGKKAYKSIFFSFGHPNTENGSKAEENHVSKTSSSYVKIISSEFF